MSDVRNGFLDDTLRMIGLSVVSGAVVGGLILSFLPRREATTSRNDVVRKNKIRATNSYTDSGSLAIREGFSMAEAKAHSEKAAKCAKSKKPEDVYKDLQRGNARFWMGCATRPEVDAFNRRSLIMQQFPSVVILGCSDSRVRKTAFRNRSVSNHRLFDYRYPSRSSSTRVLEMCL